MPVGYYSRDVERNIGYYLGFTETLIMDVVKDLVRSPYALLMYLLQPPGYHFRKREPGVWRLLEWACILTLVGCAVCTAALLAFFRTNWMWPSLSALFGFLLAGAVLVVVIEFDHDSDDYS